MAIPPALEPWVKLLRHPPGAFDPAAMTANAGAFNAQTLERFAWDYEILSQLEALAGEGVLTLYGGGCTMLHLDIADQRASVDLDLFCWVGSDQPSREAWDNCAAGLTARLGAINEKYFQLVGVRTEEPKDAHADEGVRTCVPDRDRTSTGGWFRWLSHSRRGHLRPSTAEL